MKNTLLPLVFVLCCFGNPIFIKAQSVDAEKKIASLIDNYNFTEAIKQSDNYLAGDTSNIRLLLLKSKALKGLFQYKQSYETLRKAFQFDTTNILVVAELSDLCQIKGDNKNALLYCEKACRLQPHNIYFALQLAGLYYANQDFDKCLSMLIPLYRNDSSSQYAIRLIADSYYELKNNDSSEYWYQKILSASPYDTYAVQKLANVYIRNSNYEKGLQLTENYLKQDTLLNPVIKLNAWFYHLRKDVKTAVSRFRKSIALGDNSLFVYRKLGLSYYKQEVFDSAEMYFSKAYDMDTTDTETCFYYGVSATRSFFPNIGVKILNKTKELVMPSEQFLTNVYVELAEANNLIGKKDEALKTLQQIHEIYPENKRLFFRIGYQYDYYMRDRDKALENYELFVKNEPENNNDKEEGTQTTFGIYARKRIAEINQKKMQQK